MYILLLKWDSSKLQIATVLVHYELLLTFVFFKYTKRRAYMNDMNDMNEIYLKAANYYSVGAFLTLKEWKVFLFSLAMYEAAPVSLVKGISLHDWCHEGVMHSNALVTRLCNALRDGGRV